MASPLALSVSGLSKRYRLGQHLAGQGLRHLMQEAATAPLRWWRGSARTPTTDPADFWALRDVSFDLEQGEVLGIIGSNGAGKSTLLKILSRITEPTEGRIGIRGRMASLLEVGTGFHPELTGRENIFVNGAILGMTRAEVRRQLDEIIAFAGIEAFLDTPVKRYSSGMYVRLAFAVAAHLEPEILVVDEVLAVGDAEFQKKCLAKMKQVTHSGRTVLFVSHNLPAVAALCTKAIYLKAGQLIAEGEPGPLLQQYQNDAARPTAADPQTALQRRGSGTHRIIELRPAAAEMPARAPLAFTARLQQLASEGPFHFSLHVLDEWETNRFAINTSYLDQGPLQAGDQTLDIEIRSPWLPPGDYRVEAFLYAGGIIDHWPDACRFRIGADVTAGGYTHASAQNAGLALADFRMERRAP